MACASWFEKRVQNSEASDACVNNWKPRTFGGDHGPTAGAAGHMWGARPGPMDWQAPQILTSRCSRDGEVRQEFPKQPEDEEDGPERQLLAFGLVF